MKSKVLIVDDEKDICFLISEILIDENFTTKTSVNSSQAIKLFNEFQPDLVILDVWLGKNDLDGMHRQINHLNRLLNLERLSYSESYDEAIKKPSYYKSLPAIHPVYREKGKFSSGYGYRRDPFDRKYKFHDGHDYSAKTGTPVKATGDGVIRKSKYWGTYGNYIEIDHGNGFNSASAILKVSSQRSPRPGPIPHWRC